MKKKANQPSVENSDFSGKDLSGRDFSNIFLIGADFSGAKCHNCNFSGADLSYAIFKDADLYRANFAGAVLYVTLFENCNLTRANFDGSYVYGMNFRPFVNITYSSFEKMRLEERRRQGTILSSIKASERENYRVIKMGDSMAERSVASLSRWDRFCCNGYCFDRGEYGRDERELHTSQIYNRLKRIFKENNFEREAAEFYFLERYWLTRSWHKQDYSGRIIEQRTFGRFARTLFSKTTELVCGYGERPVYVIGWLLGGWLGYSLLYMKGSFEQPLTLSNTFFTQWLQLCYYSICYLLNISNDMKPLGFTKILAVSETIYGAVFLAILTATIVRKIIRD